jgi:50S ribosomal subunit-associated GTPase HflX
LVRLRRPDEHPWAVDAAFDAIEAWLAAAGHAVVYRVWQRRWAPAPGTYLGRGKALQLRALCDLGGVDTVVIDGTPTPAQRAQMQRLLVRPILDRAGWTSGGTESPALSRTRGLHRRNRSRRGARRVVLIGCAGAGKSTLFAALTGGPLPPPSWPPSERADSPNVLTRRLRGESRREVLVTDTPGLVWQPERGGWSVPRETAAEWRETDLVLHVIDASHPEAQRRERQVARLLRDACVSDRAVLPVWTQADRAVPSRHDERARVTVSGRSGWGCESLIARLRMS